MRLILGDCLDAMRGLESDSVDAVVTDPPAGVDFMNRTWDRFPCREAFLEFLTPRLAAARRLAKPGARLLCWALPRTSHWTGTAVEDAGWVIEDKCYHLFGTGFPKHKSKLKPAVEEWVLAIKPAHKAVELQIGRCRIATNGEILSGGTGTNGKHPGWDRPWMHNGKSREGYRSASGRYPANLALSHSPDCERVGTRRVKTSVYVGRNRDGSQVANQVLGPRRKDTKDATYADADGTEEVQAWQCVEGCPVAELDRQSGKLNVVKSYTRSTNVANKNSYEVGFSKYETGSQSNGYGDSGGASRFFATFQYVPKASRSDRGEGNTHPTCKSTTLMRWLCRLITPPGGLILDPFAGSGSTGLAARTEGFDFLGIEDDPESYATAEARLAALDADQPLFAGSQ
jgi:DNA modification methylase